MKDKKALVIGSLNYDIILKQKRLPNKGETYVVDGGVTTCGGGKGANQAVQCSKMDVKTMMFGAVGKDVFGDYICEQLLQYGVDISLVKRSEESTGLGINNVLEDGSLYANIVPGANYSLKEDDIDKIEHEIMQSQVIIFQLEIPIRVVEHAIKIANKNNCYIILNAAPPKILSEKTLRNVDCFILNESEASFYLHKPINSLSDVLLQCGELYKKSKELVIITLGEKGCLLCNDKEKIYLPARNVQAIDTTGAGDSFVGTFAAKLIEGVNYLEAAIYATIAASLTVTEIGSQIAMPYKAVVEEIYKKEQPQVIYY